MYSDAVLASPRKSVVGSLFDTARAWPNQIAVECGQSTWSYSDLTRDAGLVGTTLRARLRGTLRQHGLIALQASPSYDLVACLLGGWIAGAAIALVDPTAPTDQQKRVLEIADQAHLAPELLESATLEYRQNGSHPVQGLPDDDSPAYATATSGTSGDPKFVVASHTGLASFLDWERNALRVTPVDRVAQLTNPSFDVVYRDLLLPLTSGATLVIPEHRLMRATGAVLEWMRRTQITILHAVPSLARRWMARIGDREDGLPALRASCFAGEPLDVGTCRDWLDVTGGTGEIWNFYGPTETTLAKFASRVDVETAHDPLSVGRPIADCQVEVIGENGRVLPKEEVGEIAIITPHRTIPFSGTLDETWSRRSEVGSRYLTGDFGSVDETGNLTLLGRKDDQLKIDGVRVNPAQVSRTIEEAVESQCGAPALARVFPYPDEGRLALACVIDAQPALVDVDALRASLLSRLASALLPRWIAVLQAPPVTPNGKLDRDAVIRHVDGGTADSADAEPGLLRAVLDATALVGDATRPSPHDDVFALGIDSLDAEEMAAMLLEETGLDVEAADIHVYRTPARIASAIANRPLEQLADSSGDRDASGVTPQQRRFSAFYMDGRHRSWSNVQVSFPIEANVPRDEIQESLECLARRHDILRSVFAKDRDGKLIVRYDACDDVEVEEHLTDSPNGLGDKIDELRATALDPSVKPWRADRLRGADNDILLLTFHHLVADGRTKEIVVNELRAILRGQLLPAEPRQLWMLAPHEQARERSANDRYLDEIVEELRTAETLGIGDEGGSEGSASVQVGLDRQLVSDLRRASVARGGTLFSVMLTQFAQAVAGLAGKPRLRVLVPTNGRTQNSTGVVGNFHNLVPVSVAAGDSSTHVQSKLSTGLERQCVQLDTVAKALGLSPGADPHPISSVIFNAAPGDGDRLPVEPGVPRHDVRRHDIRHQIAGTWTTGPVGKLGIDYRLGVIDSQGAQDLLTEQVERLRALTGQQ